MIKRLRIFSYFLWLEYLYIEEKTNSGLGSQASYQGVSVKEGDKNIKIKNLSSSFNTVPMGNRLEY